MNGEKRDRDIWLFMQEIPYNVQNSLNFYTYLGVILYIIFYIFLDIFILFLKQSYYYLRSNPLGFNAFSLRRFQVVYRAYWAEQV